MNTVRINNEKVFQVKPDESLLDGAIASKSGIAYSCKSGRCGVCRCRVVKGRVRLLQVEQALGDEELATGWVLACCRCAESDVDIEVDFLHEVELPEVVQMPVKISSLKMLCKDVMKIILRLPPNSAFKYLPGQYVNINNKVGITRSYSIANFDGAGVLELHIKIIPGGIMSDYWRNHATIGDLLRITGPLGTSVLVAEESSDLIFFATGTGIAPIKAMLESIAMNQGGNPTHKRNIRLYWGARYPGDFYINDFKKYDFLKFTPVLSRSDEKWIGKVGYIQNIFELETIHLRENTKVYACGSEKMVLDTKRILTQMGLSPKYFYSDPFVQSGI